MHSSDAVELGEMQRRLYELTQRVANLEELSTAVEELAAELNRRRYSEPAGIAWLDLDSANQSRATLDALQAWMSTVLTHYPAIVRLLRPCWYRHPAAVQLLLDLRDSWLLAYRADDDPAVNRRMTWTCSDLPRVEERLAHEMSRCTSVQHDPDHAELPLPDPTEVDHYLHTEWWKPLP